MKDKVLQKVMKDCRVYGELLNQAVGVEPNYNTKLVLALEMIYVSLDKAERELKEGKQMKLKSDKNEDPNLTSLFNQMIELETLWIAWIGFGLRPIVMAIWVKVPEV